MKKGFTFIELMFIIAVTVVLVGIVSSSFSNFGKHQELVTAAEVLSSVFFEARSYTISSKNASSYGVHIESDRVTRFTGETYDQNDPNNKVVMLRGAVTISETNLQGGGSDVIFNRLTGDTNQYGTIIISRADDGSQTRVITITKTGFIEVGD
ncbi:MAG: hypothetical protein Q8P52_03235 [bacterium]|nr:hypothetical protein [bacterium]